MARKPKDNKGQELWTKANWQGFVNVGMTMEEKKHVKANLLTEEAGLEFLMNVATDGYKCSMSYSIPEDVYTVSLTGQYQGRPNAGVTMSLRHREMIVCLSALSWCHQEAGVSGEWGERWEMKSSDNW